MEEEVRAIMRAAVEAERLKTGLGTRTAVLSSRNGLRDEDKDRGIEQKTHYPSEIRLNDDPGHDCFVSEVMRLMSNRAVVTWLDLQAAATVLACFSHGI